MTKQEIITSLQACDYWNKPNQTNDLLWTIYQERHLLLELEVDRRPWSQQDGTKTYHITDDYGREVYKSHHRYMNAVAAMTQGLYRLAQLIEKQ